MTGRRMYRDPTADEAARRQREDADNALAVRWNDDPDAAAQLVIRLLGWIRAVISSEGVTSVRYPACRIHPSQVEYAATAVLEKASGPERPRIGNDVAHSAVQRVKYVVRNLIWKVLRRVRTDALLFSGIDGLEFAMAAPAHETPAAQAERRNAWSTLRGFAERDAGLSPAQLDAAMHAIRYAEHDMAEAAPLPERSDIRPRDVHAAGEKLRPHVARAGLDAADFRKSEKLFGCEPGVEGFARYHQSRGAAADEQAGAD